MDCPLCNKKLKSIQFQNQSLDICLKCGGAWFEEDQLYKVINTIVSKNKIDYRTIQEAYRKKLIASGRGKQIIRKCPRCTIDMHIFSYSYNSYLFLDKCPFCGGIWTDRKELKQATKYVQVNPTIASYAKVLTEAQKQFFKIRSNKRKIVALSIAGLYLIIAFYLGQPGDWLRVLGFLILPLSCICYGEKLSNLTRIKFRLPLGIVLTETVLASFIVFTGWILLFLPLIIAFWSAI